MINGKVGFFLVGGGGGGAGCFVIESIIPGWPNYGSIGRGNFYVNPRKKWLGKEGNSPIWDEFYSYEQHLSQTSEQYRHSTQNS